MTRLPAALDEVLHVLKERRDLVSREAGLVFVGVVGSLARGDARAEGDVDVVFDATDRFSYWRLGGVLSDLQERLGREVDLVDWAMMRPDRRAYMSRDLVPSARQSRACPGPWWPDCATTWVTATAESVCRRS